MWGSPQGTPLPGMCSWVVMGEGWFANHPYEGMAGVGEGVMGSRRRGNGGWGRAPTRDDPTGDGLVGGRDSSRGLE